MRERHPAFTVAAGSKRLSREVRRGAALVRQTSRQFGTLAAARYLLDRMVNSVVRAESWKIVVRERDRLLPQDPAMCSQFSCRTATLSDLEAMQSDPRLGIGESRLRSVEAGDVCLLSFVDGQVAGYTWARREGPAEIMPGLQTSIPEQLFYDYAALTLPEYRGLGLHAYRQDRLLTSDQFADKAGLFGFVRATNFASRHTIARTGGRIVGTLWLFGTRRHFVARFSRSARRLGMCRLG